MASAFPVRFPLSWPHSLRRQLLFAVLGLALLILAGGLTALYALHTSAMTIRLLAEKRLVQMQEAQGLVQRTLVIEADSYQLADASSLSGMRGSYDGITRQLTEFDNLVDQLAANAGSGALLDLHQSSQLFRNAVNVAAQLQESELQKAVSHAGLTPDVIGKSERHYLRELHRQAEALMSAAQSQSEHFTRRYREAVRQLDETTRRNMRWVMLLMAGSLILAWIVAQWFLGHHVLGRLLLVSNSLRLGDDDHEQERQTGANQGAERDEIDEMAHAARLFREDRRKLKQRTEELVLARNAADAANRAKSVFLANMSHELRTPLNAILGFSQMMRQEPGLTPTQYENLNIINHSGEHLLKLINDVLEIAKIEAGRLQLEIADFDLHALVRDVVDMMRLRAREKGLRLLLDQSSEFPHYIKGDEARLRQTLVNLVGNAVKFTDQGGVTVRLGVKNNTGRHLLIEVEDTGPGISETERQRLFKPFVQLSEGTSHGGTGLGLSIVYQFVQLMHGTIDIESNPGKGSLFRIELPLETADDAATIAPDGIGDTEMATLVPGQPGYRILIAEDQRDNQLLLAKLMAGLGMETKVVGDGEECVTAFRQWRPDLIWMDRRMPVMDGIEATRRIRQLPGGDKVKIVAITASVFKEQQAELQTAGMDDYVRKPYRFNEIYDSLARQLGLKFTCHAKEETDKTDRGKLTPQMLTPLSEELRQQLRDALLSLDNDRIVSLVERIESIDMALGQHLAYLVDEFDYPSILDALDGATDRGQP